MRAVERVAAVERLDRLDLEEAGVLPAQEAPHAPGRALLDASVGEGRAGAQAQGKGRGEQYRHVQRDEEQDGADQREAWPE